MLSFHTGAFLNIQLAIPTYHCSEVSKYFSFRNAYMVYLMCRSRSHQVVKIMGHDVKQFKSLEGFLESGPQFVLQSYIILRGDKEGIEDFDNIKASKYEILQRIYMNKSSKP